MKSLKIFILLVIGLLCNETQSQETPFGNWYTPVRNKLFSIKIANDTLFLGKQSFDLKVQRLYGDPFKMKVEKIVTNNENYNFIVSEKNDSTVLYRLFIFKISKPKKEIKMRIDSYTKSYHSITEAENEIGSQIDLKNEITLLSESEITEIQKLKKLNQLTAADFNLIAEECIKRENENSSKYKKEKFKLNLIYSESQSRLIFTNYGYNPLVKGNTFDEIIGKFATNPETKATFEKLISNEGKQ